MKQVKFQEYNNEELNNKLATLKQDLFNYRFKHATGQLENGNLLSLCKKDIARVKTILRQRELGLAVEPVAKTVKKVK
jgi:large subunit ribosomal protein L29